MIAKYLLAAGLKSESSALLLVIRDGLLSGEVPSRLGSFSIRSHAVFLPLEGVPISKLQQSICITDAALKLHSLYEIGNREQNIFFDR